MNDEKLERHLRELPAPELPASWRAEILAQAMREAQPPAPARAIWPPLLLWIRNRVVRNPFSAGALATLWVLILLFKATTPVDPSEKELLAHYDPNRPVYLVSLQDEIRLAEFLQEDPKPRAIP